ISNAPATSRAAIPSRNAPCGRRRKKYPAKPRQAMKANNHHDGGRQANFPSTTPVAKAHAAHSMGWRGRGSQTPRALDFEFTTQSEEGLPHQVQHAFQVVGLGEQILHVNVTSSIDSLAHSHQVTGEGSRIA